MTKGQRAVLLAAGLAAAATVLFPPYFAMDVASGGRSHAFVGRYPLWSPPSPELARQALAQRGAAGADSTRPAQVVVRLNVVRLSQSMAVLVLLAGVAFVAFRDRRPRAVAP